MPLKGAPRTRADASAEMLGQLHAAYRFNLEDRAMGAMIGSALGDAVGLYTEFLLSVEEVIDIYGDFPAFKFHPPPVDPEFTGDEHRGNHPEGNWSDETDHAIVMTLSFLSRARTCRDLAGQISYSVDQIPLPPPRSIARRILIWLNNGNMALGTYPIGSGSHTRATVWATDRTNAKGLVPAYTSAPNGALMRTHPLGIMTTFRPELEAFEAAANLCKPTHFDPRCVISCVIGTGLVRACMRGEIRHEQHIDALVNRAVAWYIGWETDADALTRFNRATLDAHVAPVNGFDGLHIHGGSEGYT
ncbi:ADP-ribosylglycohydrolase-domain-containing protein [Podospora fimiseda]|uniref:ADP-ribosylglycohydrolase-domain-containing protein n=1 Tax=Podospora fimiseda TaxID=252190 RepID=A0AAN6YNG6_9PEZI|nr:ADP-ribosylglycohydrolase-domain-containing protein [Podospora fimiseda]